MSDFDLLQRLTAMRTAARRRLVLYGLCATIGGGLLALTFTVLLDWWLWLPPVPRLAVGVLFTLVCVVAAWRWVLRPLGARFTLSEMAGKLERRFPHLGDALTSTVSFLQARTVSEPSRDRQGADGEVGEPSRDRQGADHEANNARTRARRPQAPPTHFGSQALIRRAIEETDRRVRRIPLEQVLTLRPLARCALGALAAIVVVAMIAWASPGWYGTGLVRYVQPFGSAEWPRRVEIQALQGDTQVAFGGALPIRMLVTRGIRDDLRGIIRVREADGEISTFAMQREGPADFHCQIDQIVTDLVYWFEAGDADTRDAPCRVTVVKPPAVTNATARVFAPTYAQPRPPQEWDLAGGEVRAVVGSTLALAVRSSASVGIDERGRPMAYLEFDAAPVVPLDIAGADLTDLSGSFKLREDDTFRIVLRDANGFENDSRRDFHLSAVPDAAPAVTVVEPAALTEVTPTGSVALVVRAEDDFGIRRIRLTGERLNRTPTINLPLADDPPVTPRGDNLTAEIRSVWELAPLQLQAGDVVVYRVVVTDNCADHGAPGQSTSSAPLRLKTIAKADLEKRLRDELSLLEARVRQALLDQEAMRDEIGPLADGIAADVAWAPSTTPSEHARRLAQRQLRLGDQLRRLAGRFEQVCERVRLNNAFDERTHRQVGDVVGQLDRTASGSMTQAARALDRLGDRPASDDPIVATTARRMQLTTAQTAQATAVDELQQVLRWMGRWGDFQAVVAKTRDLLDRQQQVRAAALRQGRAAVGKPIDSLTDKERTSLKRVVREQKQLAREMDQWLDRGRSLRERLQAKDPASVQALDGALRAAVAHRVLPRMKQSAEALDDNRTAAASIEQRAAESGLAAVLSALEARQARELAALRKSVEHMLGAVAEVLRRQEALLAAVEEAVERVSLPARPDATTNALANLADEQHAVRRNTQRLGDQMSESPGAARAAAEMDKAPAPMRSAERELRASVPDRAVVGQREAIALLQAALEELRLLAARTEQRIMRQTLAQTRRKLQDIRDRQEEVNGETGELVEKRKVRGRLSRATARRASRLAARQGDIRERTEAVRSELESVVVYVWVLNRVGETMVVSRQALTARRLDDALMDSQRWIVSELGHLIDAIASIENLPSPDDFVDGGGGGGAIPVENQPLVPPVAELIVIKTMQKALNERTGALHAAFVGIDPTEEDLRRARALGHEQEQLRELTERVTRKARTGD